MRRELQCRRNRRAAKFRHCPSYLRRHRLLALLRLFALAVGLGIALAAGATDAGAPEHLRDTGLYAPGSTSVVRADNLPFTPQYPLWSDGTTKRRWLYLPP